MAELKTKVTDDSVVSFLAGLKDDKKREDAHRVLAIMKEITKSEPKMWGPTIVGFGSYHYKYASGREGDWFVTGFSPRKQALTLYIMAGFSQYDVLMQKLGKYKTGKSCLYVKKLDDIDENILRQLIEQSTKYIKEKYR
ncbi:hypothetical protein C900_00291 [Fulvivirga imtechensis AK7]|uniref:YdhG-like domain-containing protein n=1 Tax=Fulvivirga imtechensis AK7 TaxID=1237149 RepID=L8JI99_9BACT|nr:DUF1801 domain-containing protein [Fulvivirga imtechensis]ELR68550.1 hypothetical protein C900_00291 [Fulvivirga imtechensis AK7]